MFGSMLVGFLGLLTLWLWTRDRAQPALGYWAASRLIGAVGTLLLGLRGNVSDWLSIDVANTLVCLGYAINWTGVRRFEGRQPVPWLILAGAVAWLAALQVPAFRADVYARVALMACVLIAYNALSVVEFVRGQRVQPLPSRPLMIMLLVGVTALYVVTVFLVLLLIPQQGGDPLSFGFWFGALAILHVVYLTGGTLILVVLTKERAEVRSNAVLAAARDEADRASLHKTHFLSRMSHELRTPLNAVLGMAQVLARDATLGPEQRRKAETLEQAGRHLLAILNDVLDMARIEAGRFATIPRPLRLEDFLRDTLALMQEVANAKGVRLSMRLEPSLPAVVSADEVRVRQVLMNLLSNAIRFTPAGGAVVLEVAPWGGPGSMMAAFAVTDTGSGVPAAMRARLFEAFSQASLDDTRGGSGLGLAISAALARAMGGGLSHADGPGGQGSRFTLLLPVPAATLEATAEPAAPPAVRGLRVLVVDDVQANRLVVEALLSPEGHHVIEAASGEAALELLATEPLPDLILLDGRMPGLSGSDTLARIRAMPGPAGRLPVIALTADVLPDQVREMQAAGFDGHLSKPIEHAALLAVVARWGGARRDEHGNGKLEREQG